MSSHHEESMCVMEGESVTLNTGVENIKQKEITWYFNGIRVAKINGDQGKICTDVQCNEGTERFRDRLKLKHQTGSLTIKNISKTDAGNYRLEINNSDKKTFKVTVIDVPAAEQDEMKIKTKEGESVILHSGVSKKKYNNLMWYFNDTLIAEITGDQNEICTHNECKERFRDRLELDHQTGSLTIMNITNTDSGVYYREISSSNFSIIRSFSVTVTESALSSGLLAGICAAFTFLMAAVAAVFGFIYFCRRSSGKDKGKSEQKNTDETEKDEGRDL